MANGYWKHPVILEVHGVGRYRTIMTTTEAIECLKDEWLFDGGELYEQAFASCLLALERRVDHEFARVNFIQAAYEAAIYVVPEDSYGLAIATADRRTRHLHVN